MTDTIFTAVDTETELIPSRREVAVGNQRVKVEPFQVPRLVLGTSASTDGGKPEIHGPEETAMLVNTLLRQTHHHLVFHNAAFDLRVLIAHTPSLEPLILQALADGRIHDTMHLDLLIRLADGYFDTPQPHKNYAKPDLRPRTLATLAQGFLGIELDKDPDIRLGFGQYLREDGTVDLNDIPDRAKDYALADTEATLAVWLKMKEKVPPSYYGEPMLTRHAYAVSRLDERGVRVDKEEAQRLHRLFREDLAPLQQELVDHRLAEWTHVPGSIRSWKIPLSEATARFTDWDLYSGVLVRIKRFAAHARVEMATPKFHLIQSRVRTELEGLLAERPDIPFVTTPTGLLSLRVEDYKDHIPPDRPALQTWAEHEKLKKILNTYLDLYSQLDVCYPRWYTIGARSGRMSSASPNLQNVPKRKHGIRSLFVARPGYVFVKADYSYQELVTLAEAMDHLGIYGPLASVIRSGEDPHTSTAARLLNKELSMVSKQERQGAKALNFGIPGGLGPKKLADYATKTYGVEWDTKEARRQRDAFLTVYPDIRQYLRHHDTNFAYHLTRATGRPLRDWKRMLHVASMRDLRNVMRLHPDPRIRHAHEMAERALRVELPTGRVRGCARYTEAANTRFQGLAADVTKEALFLCSRRGLRVVLVVHDELVVECLPEEAACIQEALEECMLEAFHTICPIFGPHAKVESEGPLERWGPATDAQGKSA